MLKLSILLIVTGLAVVMADYNVRPRGMIHQIQKRVAGPNPYIFLTVPKGRSQSVIQGFEVIEDNDDDKKHKNLYSKDMDDQQEDYENDNEDEEMPTGNEHLNEEEDDDEQQMNDVKQGQANLNEVDEDEDEEADEFDNIMKTDMKLRKPAKATQMMVSRQHAGAIMVPDKIIEIEAQTVIDEKTGKAALLLPRSILDSIDDGSIIALMERPASDESEGRANRVIVRRRRKGSRLNLKRRAGGNTRYRVVQQGGSNRRNNLRRQNVVVVRRRNGRNGNNKRRVNRRGVSLQG